LLNKVINNLQLKENISFNCLRKLKIILPCSSLGLLLGYDGELTFPSLQHLCLLF
jgi:hypothetical protein